MIKVYIAAPYPERTLAIKTMKRLEWQGCEVTSRWLKGGDALTDEWARNDLEDVARADLLLALNPEGYSNVGTGGRHVELGYAIALNKAILLVGERTNIFHYLSNIKVIDGAEDLVKQLKKLYDVWTNRQ